jgi:membrane fusion protein, heavy metal efflux system
MSSHTFQAAWHIGVVPVCSAVLGVVLLIPPAVLAHEGHAPLPSKGATVQGDRLLLSPAAAKAIGLETAKIDLGDLESSVVANTTVEIPCHHHAFATTLVRGKVIEVLKHPGDAVRAGQELARVESVVLEAMQLEMLHAFEEWQLAERLLEQREQVAGSIAIQTLLESRATRLQKAARFGVAWQKLRAIGISDQRLAAIRASGQPLVSLAIVSPIGGVIADANVRVGQMVEPTEHLYSMVNRSEVWLNAAVLEPDSVLLRVGMPASVRLDALQSKPLIGKLEYISPVVDSQRHTVVARFSAGNADDVLRQGMFGKMSITVAKASQEVLCPVAALLRDAGGEFVLLEEGRGKYVRRPLVVGLRTHQFVEVRDGLFPGDRVVTTGNHELAALFPARVASETKDAAKNSAGKNNQSTTKADPPPAPLLTIAAQIELPTERRSFASSAIEGRITELLAERGQHVKRGMVLAEVESLDLQSWQLDFAETGVLLRFTKAWSERLSAAATHPAVPEKDAMAVKARYLAYEHTERSLAQKLRMVGLSDEDLARIEKVDLTSPEAAEKISTTMSILAPADGTVADFELSLGQVVGPDQHLFQIVDSAKVWAKGFLFERDAARIHVGQAVEVELVCDPSFRAPARITRISPVLESKQRAVCVWAEIDNPQLRAKEGMLARIVVRPLDGDRGLAAERP